MLQVLNFHHNETWVFAFFVIIVPVCAQALHIDGRVKTRWNQKITWNILKLLFPLLNSQHTLILQIDIVHRQPALDGWSIWVGITLRHFAEFLGGKVVTVCARRRTNYGFVVIGEIDEGMGAVDCEFGRADGILWGIVRRSRRPY